MTHENLREGMSKYLRVMLRLLPVYYFYFGPWKCWICSLIVVRLSFMRTTGASTRNKCDSVAGIKNHVRIWLIWLQMTTASWPKSFQFDKLSLLRQNVLLLMINNIAYAISLAISDVFLLKSWSQLAFVIKHTCKN